jgi:hypothetical protein
VGGGTIIEEAPPERAYPLKRLEYMNLCQGEQATGDERWRDVCIGVSAASLLGLIAILATVDLNKIGGFSLVMCFLEALTFVASLLGVLFFHKRAGKAKTTSSCAYVHRTISEFFEKTNSTH